MRQINLHIVPRIFVDQKIEKEHRSWAIIWLAFLYFIGVLLWGFIFNWRQTSLNYHDWTQINLPRIQVIKEAFQTATLPLHLADTAVLHNLTDRFFAIPDVITTPQMILLNFMDSDTFVLLDLLIYYTIATAGLLYFRKKFHLSLFTFSILFFLFNFNGYILSHYLVGHITWAGYFLFPWFFILVFEFVETQPDWRWVAKMAFLSFYTVLAGSQHHFTWMLLFLSFLGLANWHKLKWAIVSILASGFLSAVRLLPPVLIIGNVKDHTAFQFQGGYNGTGDLLLALTHIQPVDYLIKGATIPLGYWEFNYFLGIVGFLFLATFGLFFWVRDQYFQKRFTTLFLPLFITFLLSTGFIYGKTLYSLPIFSSERVISRMISIPITGLMFIAAYYFDEWLKRENTTHIYYWLSGAGLILLINDLLINMHIWNIQTVSEQFEKIPLQFSKGLLGNHADSVYTNILMVGFLLTIITATTLTILFSRVRQEKQS